jgi:hypothetical protein
MPCQNPARCPDLLVQAGARATATPGVADRVDVVGLVADDRAALSAGYDRRPQVRPDDDRLIID